MKRYALFLDIDGTIATYRQPISRELQRMLLYLKELRHKIFICTGRGYSDIPDDIRNLVFDGYICSTGAYIRVGKRGIYSMPFPASTVHTLHKFLLSRGVSAYYESDCQIYRSEAREPLDHSVPDFKKAPVGTRFYSVAYHLAAGQGTSSFLPFPDTINARSVPQSDHSGDIIMPTCNKAAAMRILLAFLKLEDYGTIAIGDSPNDVEMLIAADLGIAMGHAPDALKRHADRITGTFEEDGACMALKNIFIKGM